MVHEIVKQVQNIYRHTKIVIEVKRGVPRRIKEWKGKKILHLSDTPYGSFDYIKRVLQEVKPEVILHTGDMVDNLKIGRMPEKLEEYERCLPELLQILKEVKSEVVYLVPGNHDNEEYIKEQAPWAQVLPEGSVIFLEKVKVGLAHMKANIPADALYYFYGHGMTGDDWRPEYNVMGKKCFFNGVLHMHLLNIQEQELIYIPYPKNVEFMRSGKKENKWKKGRSH